MDQVEDDVIIVPNDGTRLSRPSPGDDLTHRKRLMIGRKATPKSERFELVRLPTLSPLPFG
jgi:hypothetical protein